jgi:hypothetical protein
MARFSMVPFLGHISAGYTLQIERKIEMAAKRRVIKTAGASLLPRPMI